MIETYQFLSRAFSPESNSDVILWSIVILGAILFTLLRLKIFKKRYPSLVISFVITGIYILFILVIIPNNQKFDDEDYGVLLLRTSGANLTECFGRSHFSDAILVYINTTLKKFTIDYNLHELESQVKLKSVSWVANSEDEALHYLEKYNAEVVFWGHITKYKNHAAIRFNVIYEYFGVRMAFPGIDTFCVEFDITGGPDFTINFNEKIKDLDLFSSQFIRSMLPSFATYSYQKGDLQLYTKIIKNLPSINKNIKKKPYTPILLLACAEAYKELDDLENASQYFSLAYDHFKELKDKFDSEGYPVSISKIKLKRFLAFSKWEEGKIAHRFKDNNRVLDCFGLAIFDADTTLTKLILEDAKSYGLIIEPYYSDTFEEPDSILAVQKLQK